MGKHDSLIFFAKLLIYNTIQYNMQLVAKTEFTKTMIHAPILGKWVTIGDTSIVSGEGKEIRPATIAERQKMYDNGFSSLFEKKTEENRQTQ